MLKNFDIRKVENPIAKKFFDLTQEDNILSAKALKPTKE
jgi:hypothetical protein